MLIRFDNGPPVSATDLVFAYQGFSALRCAARGVQRDFVPISFGRDILFDNGGGTAVISRGYTLHVKQPDKDAGLRRSNA